MNCHETLVDQLDSKNLYNIKPKYVMNSVNNDTYSQEMLDNIQVAVNHYQEIVTYLLNNKISNISATKFLDTNKNAEIALNVMEQFCKSPDSFVQLNVEYINKLQKLVIDSVTKFSGNHANDALDQGQKEEDIFKKDNRFKDPAWKENVYFDFIRKYYLLSAEWMQKNIQQYNLDTDTRRYLEFTGKQFVDAMSPSNFIFSNPEVIKVALDTKMQNIASGMKNFLDDIKKSGDLFNISTTDKNYFKIGHNIATAEGKIVYENELMQLICYKPTETIHELPLLIVPPCINKYYILDLSAKNSLIRWLVENKYQVFLISWKNPNKQLANINFEDYISDGIFASIEHIKTYGHKKVNVAGYCIGGTMLACALAIEKKQKKKNINSATFLTTLLDFSKPGEIGAFINKTVIDSMEQELSQIGYLDGRYLSNSFSLIRANDLVWSFFVNNYLLGKSPAAFDILFWNSDATNLPATMYNYYMRNMYLDNLLKIPNKLEMLGEKIDITGISVPSFSLAAKEDHIALWQSVYDGYQLLSGDKVFCLTDAGHVAGVVNPVSNTKYSHKIGAVNIDSGEAWLAASETRSGSWWNSWNSWLSSKSGKLVKSINYNDLACIEMAPGRYVVENIGNSTIT